MNTKNRILNTMLKIKNKIYKVCKKTTLYIKKLLIFASKKLHTIYRYSLAHKKGIVISVLSLVLLVGLGFGIYKYLTTPRAPDLKPAKGGYLYSANGLDYKAFIGKKENNRPEVNFAVGKGSVVFTPASGDEKPSAPQVDGDKAVIFKNVYNNIDFRYQTIPLGIKEEIIINEPTIIRTFPFFLDFQNTSPQYVTENVKGTAFFDKDGKYLFNFEKPYAIDAKGVRTDNLGILIRKDTVTNKFVAIISLDDAWMKDPKRAYPITIDPTVIHDTTAEFATGQLDRMIDTGSGSSPNLTGKNLEMPTDVNTVALWHMNEASGNIYDSSGNSNTGTPTGTTVVSGPTGFGNARSFNGSSDYITVTNSTPLNPKNALTVEYWIKHGSTAGMQLSKGNFNQFYTYGGSSTSLRVYTSAGDLEQYSATAFNDGNWHHFAATWSNTDGKIKIYLDGALNVISSGTLFGTINSQTNALTIGAGVDAGGFYYGGSLDEVRISNIARTPEEIALDASRRPYSTFTSPVIDLTTHATAWNSLSWNGTGFATGDGETATASATTNLVAQWNFNEILGSTANNDAEGSSCGGTPASCDGTLGGFTTPVYKDALPNSGWTANNRRWGEGALMFDGSNDYINVPDSNALDITSISIGAWVRGTYTASAYHHILDKEGTYGLSVYDKKPAAFLINAGGWWYPSVPALTPGEWYYLVVTYDGATKKMYVNGVQVASAAQTGAIGVSGNAVGIGANQSGGNYYFKGVIDVVSLYSRALTASEVLSNYNAGDVELQTRVGTTSTPNDGTWEEWRPVTNEAQVDSLNSPSLTESQQLTCDGGTVSLWHLNESSGSTFTDTCGTNHGNIVGTSVVSAKTAEYVNARSLNGTSSDYLYVNDNPSLDGMAKLTVSGWINITSYPAQNSVPIGKDDNGASYRFVLGSTGNMQFVVATTNNGWYTNGTVATSSDNLSTGTWYYITGTYDGSYVRVYVNGVLKGTGSQAISGTIVDSAARVTFGYNSAVGIDWYNGKVDEISISNVAKNVSEILQEYHGNAKTINTSVDTTTKIESTGSEKIQTGILQANGGTAALWHLEEVSGTSAYIKDVSVNANNGTPTGTTLVEGFAGKGRSFNGSSDYINIGNTSSLTFERTNPFSISAWVKTSYTSAEQTIVAKMANVAPYRGYALSINTSGKLRFALINDTATTNRMGVYGSSVVNDGTWHHVTATYNGTSAASGVKMYVDGILQANTIENDTLSATIVATTNFNIASRNNAGLYFNGALDEIQISNIVRTSEEISETYRAGRDHVLSKTISSTDLSPATKLPFYVAADRLGTYSQFTIGESAYANYETDAYTTALLHLDEDTNPVYNTGMVGWWQMNEASGTTSAPDSSGSNNHGTSSSSTNVATGLFSNARSFNGTSEYVSIGTNTSLDFSTGFTLEAWVYRATSQNSVDSAIVAKISGSPYNGYMLYYQSDNTVDLYINGGIRANSTYTIPANSWTHVVATWDGTTPKVYINGALSVTGATYSTAPTSSGQTFEIGRYPTASRFFTGRIDEARAYNTALSATQIADNYATSVYIRDSSGNDNSAVSAGNTKASLGKIGKGRSFNGSSDYILIPSNSGLRPTDDFTVEAWAYFTDFSDYRTILHHDEDGGGDDGYIFRAETDGRVSFSPLNTNGYSNQTVYSNTVLQAGKWYHVAGVYRNYVAEIYINGILDNTKVMFGNVIYSVTSNLNIGRRGGTSTPNTNFMKGYLDEIRISNTPRTADEIRQAYEIGSRTHNITIDFKAALDFANLITGSGDTSFWLDETAYGSSAMANHIFPGDKIIVRENYNGTEYIAQGTVATVNPATGVTTVTSWDTGSTFPAAGYTVNATVFKWQREYFDITGSLSEQRDAVTRLSYRITDGSMGANIWLDDIRSSGGYLTSPLASTITSSTGSRYFQYRAILSQNNIYNSSAALTSVTLNYESNHLPNTPTLDSPTNAAVNQNTLTVLKTTATDDDSNNLQYKIELCKDSNMSVSCQTFNQSSSQTGWSGQNADGNTTYTSGTQATYTIQSALDANTTYYWRSYAIDPAGRNAWGATQATPYSFTTTSAPSEPTYLLTQGQINPTNVVTLTPYFSAIHNDPNGDSANYYQIQLHTSSDFSGTPKWDSGKVSMTTTANGVRSPNITYSGSALSWATTYYWRIKFWDTFGQEGSYSSLAQFTTDSAAGSCRIQETASDGSLTVVWTDNATTETGYEVQRSVDGGGFSILHTGLAAGTTSDTDNTTSSGHTYQYKVAPLYSGTAGNWCTTQTLTLQVGVFSVGGLDLKGLDLR